MSRRIFMRRLFVKKYTSMSKIIYHFTSEGCTDTPSHLTVTAPFHGAIEQSQNCAIKFYNLKVKILRLERKRTCLVSPAPQAALARPTVSHYVTNWVLASRGGGCALKFRSRELICKIARRRRGVVPTLKL